MSVGCQRLLEHREACAIVLERAAGVSARGKVVAAYVRTGWFHCHAASLGKGERSCCELAGDALPTRSWNCERVIDVHDGRPVRAPWQNLVRELAVTLRQPAYEPPVCLVMRNCWRREREC